MYAYQITNQLCARSDSLQQIRIATQEDDELVLLKHTITQGWPSNTKEVPSVIQSYWTFREELTIEDGTILKGTRIVIPAKKQETVLKLIHEGHLGLNKCKLCAKETVYWLGLNDQLEKLVLNCELFKIFTIKMQAEAYHVFGIGDSIKPLDQASHRFVPLSRCILHIACGLYK